MHDELKLRLTSDADLDLSALYAEGFVAWGEAQADTYYDGLLRRLEQIRRHPFMYPAVDEVRSGYRRSVCERHSIYYVVGGCGGN